MAPVVVSPERPLPAVTLVTPPPPPPPPPVPALKTNVFVTAEVIVTFIPLKFKSLVLEFAANCVTPLICMFLNMFCEEPKSVFVIVKTLSDMDDDIPVPSVFHVIP